MSAFATTQWSLVARAGLSDEERRREALESLCRTYWKPVFLFVRMAGLDEESAKDVTQAFFARMLERNTLVLADRERGRFRTFLLTMVKRFLSDWRDHGNRLKRGGGVVHVPLETGGAPPLTLVSGEESPEDAFDRRWAQTLMERVVALLGEEAAAAGRETLFAALCPYLSSEPDAGAYAEIAARFRLSRGAVAMAVHRLRARFRELTRREVAETLADPGDLEEEMAALRAALAGGRTA